VVGRDRSVVAIGARRFSIVVTAGNTAGRAFWEAAGHEPRDQVRDVKTFPAVR
jgi:hypothetical protein